MSTQQENLNITDAQATLTPALLEKLASNILALTPHDLETLPGGQQSSAKLCEVNDGL